MCETNCPNCGAPITGPRCEYCGTVFDWNTTVKLDGLNASDLLRAISSFRRRVGIFSKSDDE